MLTVTIVVAAAGLVVGLRFNVFVFALLLSGAAASVFAIGVWSGDNALVVALQLLATFASVQIGCLIAAQFPARVTMPSGLTHMRYSHTRVAMR